jgi:hypothetical protein
MSSVSWQWEKGYQSPYLPVYHGDFIEKSNAKDFELQIVFSRNSSLRFEGQNFLNV